MILLSPLPFVYCHYRTGMERDHYRKVVSAQFRELLNCVNNALRAGDSPENAFREGYREVRYEYGEFAPVKAGRRKYDRDSCENIRSDRRKDGR